MLASMGMSYIRSRALCLNCAVELVSRGGSHCAWLPVNDSRDDTGVEAIALDRNVLASGDISSICADVEDDRDGLALVAASLIEIAEGCLLQCHSSLTGLPHHRKILALGDGVLSDLTSYSIFAIRRKVARGVSSKLEVQQIAANFGIDKWKLIRVEILDETHGAGWVKPELSIRFVVCHSGSNIEDCWSISSPEHDLAVVLYRTCQRHIGWVRLGDHTDPECHGLVVVELLLGQVEQVWN